MKGPLNCMEHLFSTHIKIKSNLHRILIGISGMFCRWSGRIPRALVFCTYVTSTLVYLDCISEGHICGRLLPIIGDRGGLRHTNCFLGTITKSVFSSHSTSHLFPLSAGGNIASLSLPQHGHIIFPPFYFGLSTFHKRWLSPSFLYFLSSLFLLSFGLIDPIFHLQV